MDLIPTTGTSRVANLLVQKSISRGFVTPVFIHLADDNSMADLASRKGIIFIHQTGQKSTPTRNGFGSGSCNLSLQL